MHIYRVWQTSIKIAENEGANPFITQLAALLHDIADWKFHDGNENAGPEKAEIILRKFSIEEKVITTVKNIVRDISFKGAKVNHKKMESLEGMVVQDADRLDAIGAIGIARTFAYGGYTKRSIYDPSIKPELHDSSEKYFKNNGSSISHFYEKLLLLKDLMNTKAGKKMAEERHIFMEKYLDQFYKEWNQEV